MTELVFGSLCILFLVASLNFPVKFKLLMARICSVDESAVPEYPVGAAIPLMLFVAWVMVVPGIVSIAGIPKVDSGIALKFLLAGGAVLLLVGLLLATLPERPAQKLRWPPITSAGQAFISRLVGATMLVGGSWLLRSMMS